MTPYLMRSKLEVMTEISFSTPGQVLDLLRELEQTVSLPPSIRTRFVDYRYSTDTVARLLAHLYMSCHTHGDRETVIKMDQALDSWC